MTLLWMAGVGVATVHAAQPVLPILRPADLNPARYYDKAKARRDAIINAMDKSIAQKTVTYDFARLMEGATEVKCSEFGDLLIRNL